jgi:hypothetical protein
MSQRIIALLLSVISTTVFSFAQTPCETLKTLSLSDTTVTAVEHDGRRQFYVQLGAAGRPCKNKGASDERKS